MNESILITTTTMAFTSPIASPSKSPIATAGTMPTPSTTRRAVATPVRVITAANERSKTRAQSGIVIASAARPVTA
jgi:hypothetical protein